MLAGAGALLVASSSASIGSGGRGARPGRPAGGSSGGAASLAAGSRRHLAAARAQDTGADRAMALRGDPDAVRGPRRRERAWPSGANRRRHRALGLCHTPAGAFMGFYTDRTLAGGMEGRWRVYGSAYSTNLTPRPGDGIGGLDDRAIHRAVASGIGRAGRRMHWQAMPWDIMSHWSEEDRRAVIAYLRALPPVAGAVPAPRGPQPAIPRRSLDWGPRSGEYSGRARRGALLANEDHTDSIESTGISTPGRNPALGTRPGGPRHSGSHAAAVPPRPQLSLLDGEDGVTGVDAGIGSTARATSEGRVTTTSTAGPSRSARDALHPTTWATRNGSRAVGRRPWCRRRKG